MRTLRGVTALIFTMVFAVPHAAAKESPLIPPSQSSRDSRQNDIQTCISQARDDVSSNKPIEDDAMLLLHGHHTEGFVRGGKPVINKEDVPTPSGSLFVGRSEMYGPSALSDRYVVCLLKRGYSWADSADDVSSFTPSSNLSIANPGHPQMTKISLGHHTQGIAFTPGAIWVGYDDDPNKEDTGVFRVDASTNQIVTVLKTGRSAGWVAASKGSVWVANLRGNSVTRIDPETNRVVATVAVGKYPFSLEVGEGSVWVTNAGSNSVSRIDVSVNAVVATIPVGKQPMGITVSGASIWVANLKGKSVSRIDANTNTVVATIEVHGEPITLTARGTDVWASTQSHAGFSVVRIDAKSNVVVAETNIVDRGKIGGTALLGDVLWVADRANGTLSQVDIHTNALVGSPILVGYDATILGSGNDGNGAIWLSNSSDGTVRKLVP